MGICFPAFSQIDFTADVLQGCSPQVITFTANAPGATVYDWDLGNGANSSAANPGASYINPGFYTIRLRVTYPNGIVETVSKTNYIEIFDNPIANFTANPVQICAGESVDFTDLTQATSNPLTSWLWDFGDGDTGSVQQIRHTYTSPGTFTVTLISTDIRGCEGTEQKEALIQVNPKPDASFVADNALGCAPPFPVNFFSTGSGSAFTHTWDLGNGQTSTQVNPSTTFGQNGNYTITHIVSSSLGCSDTVVKNDLVNVGNVQVNIQVSDSVACVGQEVNFFCGGGFGSVVSWDFGVPGGSSTDCNAVFTYRTPGLYTVNVSILDPSGCSFQATQQIRVSVPPIPDFSISDTLLCDPPMISSFVNNSTGAVSYVWDFGDGTTSTDVNPTHTFPTLPISSQTGQPYFYDVKLTAYNADGCPASLQLNNSVITGQTAAFFIPTPAEGCAPLDVLLGDRSISTSPVVSWFWDLGDGTTSTLRDVNHTYTDTGKYDVSLIITTLHGCTDTIVQRNVIQVGDPPIADFTANLNFACASNSIEFTNLSVGADSAFWIFGDGLTSREYEPMHAYRDTGWMDVTLFAFHNGCPTILTKSDYIYIQPAVASFRIPELGCALPFQLSGVNESIGAHRYLWDFGDGTTSTDTIPSHTYLQEGSYVIRLTAFNDSTGCADSVSLPFNIGLIDPVIDFTTAGGCNPVIVSFSDLTTNSRVSIWDFGDGDSSFIRNPIHVYTDPGFYTVTLKAISDIGCDGRVTVTIPVSEPLVDFDVLPANRGCTEFEAQFVNLTSSPSPIANWDWTFGPAGATSTDESPMFTYVNPGFYTVSLIATDTLGCTDTLTRRNYISVFEAIPQFVVDEPVNCANNPIVFLNTSLGSGLSYFWDFGDGNTSTATNPVHTYTTDGLFDVSLTVTDFNGCDSTLILPDYINISDPLISLTADSTFADCPPLLVNFTAQALSSHTFTTWNWDFGDGASSTGINPSHLYIESGTFDIGLDATTTAGCVANITEPDYIQISGPEASFSFTPGVVCPGDPITFTTQNVVNVSEFTWDLGNGVLDSGASIVYAYPDSGIYYPILIAEDAGGCQVVLRSPDSILVYPKPIADFSVSAGQLCGGDTLTFTDLSTSDNPIQQWQWDFGISTSALQNPTVIFSIAGIYDVSLRVTNESGCRDTLVQPASIIVEPNVQPEAPEILFVSVMSDTEVTGTFAAFANTFDDFDRYIIYREDPGGIFIPIQTILNIQDTSFIDRNLDTKQNSYCYKLQVVNECGLASSLNSAQTHCSILLESADLLGQVTLNWSDYIGWNGIEEYRLYKVQGYSTTSPELIAVLPPSINSYEDFDVFCQEEKTYRIEAIKANDVLNSWSNIQAEAPLFEAPSQAMDLWLATVEADTFVEVRWGPSPGIPFADELVIEKDAGGGFTAVYSQLVSDPPRTWVDENVQVHEQSYIYRAYIQDSCGEKTPLGRIAESIHLKASRQAGTVFLSWNPYQEWENGILNYRLEVFNEMSLQFEEVSPLGPALNSFSDRKTDLPQRSYCYRVSANELEGNELTSISNIACVPIGPQIFYPNAFTPNGDQTNDVFIIKGLFIERARMMIFDRWGEKLFEGTDLQTGWDGRYKNQPVQEGVYVFRVEGVGYDGTLFSRAGTVTLIR